MIAWVVLAFIVANMAISVGLTAASHHASGTIGLVFLIVFPVVGFVLARRLPSNPLGWIMLGIGVVWSLPLDSYTYYAHVVRHDAIPGAGVTLGLSGPSWVWFIGPCGFLLMLFPDGHLPSARWRWFAWVMGIGMVLLSVAFICFPGNGADVGYPGLRNSLGIQALRPFESIALGLIVTVPLSIVGGAVAIFRRMRRSQDDTQRHQLRWLAWAGVLIAASYVLAFIPGWTNSGGAVAAILQGGAVLSFALIPIAIGIAVLKYHLYDIDVVIKKTFVFGIVALFITAVYVGIVAGVGALVGSKASPILSALAAAVVALVFQPVRARARRLGDRLVYGKRATPYEVLSSFGGRLDETYAADEVLPRMAEVLGEGVGAARAQVWLKVGDEMKPVATWPADAHLNGSDDVSVEVRHHGETLGALSVAMAASDPMNPAREELVRNLAAQAGLVLRNVRLTEDLRARLVDLSAAQRRLVTAQDAERRRLERNIHDGAQQQLVALAIKARLARSLAEKDQAKAAELLSSLENDAQVALGDLRNLARGIYPPLLADKGLVAALQAQAERAPVSVEVHSDGVRRYGQETEAAAYFCTLEALQNVAKYAKASRVTVSLSDSGEQLSFTVTDDGQGFDPSETGYGTGLQGIADRLGAIEGTFEIGSAPGRGTTVTGRIPLVSQERTDH